MKKINEIELIAKNLVKDDSITHGLRRAIRKLIKEISLFKNHNIGMGQITKNNKLSGGGKKYKIQIGGGSHILGGFLNIDIVPPADILFDVREGIPLKDESCEFIFSEHFFEHIDYPVSAKKFISECFRVLEPSGIMVLGVPNSELMISAYSKRDKKFYNKAIKMWYSNRNCIDDINTYIDLVNYYFRDQDDDAKYNPHYWAYDFEKLKFLLTDARFKTIKKWKFDPKITNPERKFGSIYVEAQK